MGHAVNPDREYRLLRQRFDRQVTGAPDSPVMLKILKLLFSPQEAEIARQMPSQLTPLGTLARRLDMDVRALSDTMRDMARRGLVIDVEYNCEQYYSLPPVVIGFFEFTFMRAREDIPMKELAQLFDTYMKQDDRFPRSVFKGPTQIGRSLVHEEALPNGNGDHTEILDWERASHVVQTATSWGVSMCACRHKASHLGKACDRALENCMSFNYAADSLIRQGLAREITASEAMQVLEASKAAGLAQTGDNVQKVVTYICNCCGCCCGMMDALKRFDIRNAIVTSNWIADVDMDKCTGCGKCAEACLVDAIEIIKLDMGGKKPKKAKRDETLCLGCGVCKAACEFGGMSMKPREKRPIVPETAYDRIVTMAIERGRLTNLLFDEPERLSYRALGRIIGVLEKSPPVKAALAIKPLRSAFLNAMVKGAKRNGREKFGDTIG
ncbi:MAG: 4Fe-4S dicluster domain-containing protein [Candidatus Latescibacterota bacterium]